MSLIANYEEIGMEQWEQQAQLACFETNQELKSQAQYFFYMFMQSPNPQLFTHLIHHASPTLLFVLFTCAYKNTEYFAKSIHNFAVLIQNILEWELKGLTFIRKNRPPLEEYVARTIMLALGVLLKALYKGEGGQEIVIRYLGELPDGYFKLYLLRSFIEAIEIIDYDMGYMKYRLLIYSFQENVIPLACDVLIPAFYKFEESMQVSELAYLQQKLDVNQTQSFEGKIGNQTPLLTREQQTQARHILLLLKGIIQFNYNITYNEYEHEIMPEAHLITFPDRVIEKIINGEFVKALFFLIKLISSAKMGSLKNEFLLIAISCLSKMMQSRISTLDQLIKENYVIECIKGINTFLREWMQIGSSAVLEEMLGCNKKLLIGCELAFIKGTIAKHMNDLQVYNSYIKDLTSVILQIIKKTKIQCQNTLLSEALETANKVLVNYGYRDECIEDQHLYFIHFAKSVIDAFLSNLCSPIRMFNANNILNIGENKAMVCHLFQHFKRLATYNYEYFFTKLQEKVDNFMANMSQQLTIVANMLFLLSEVVEKSFHERTQYLHKASSTDLAILGRVVVKCTHLMKCYTITRQVYFRQQATYIDLAAIIFTESIINEFLVGFQCINHLKIKNKLYLHMINPTGQTESREHQDNKSEEVILDYLNVLFGYLEGCLIANKQDEARMLYVLEVTEKTIFKFKWNSKREAYLKSNIFHVLESFISEFFSTFQHIVSIRSRTAKILVTLAFDDSLDEYKFRIGKFIKIVKGQPMVSILYDLMGAFEGIQTFAIARYFYNKLRKQMDLKLFLNSIFEFAIRERNQPILKDSCKLIKLMVNNKGLKANNNITVYEIFHLVLPNLIWIIKQIRLTVKENFDFWCEPLCEIIQMMNVILNGTHINIFAMEGVTQVGTNSHPQNISSAIRQYFYELFLAMSEILPSTARQYPRLEELTLNFSNSVNRQIISFILGDEGEKIPLQYAIFHFKLIDLIIEYMKEVLAGGKVQEEKLIRCIDSARCFYSYSEKQSKRIHSTIILNNLQRIFNAITSQDLDENRHEMLIFYSFSFVLSNYKYNLTILRPIGKILYWMSKIFHASLTNSLLKLQISAFMVEEFERILGRSELSEDGFVDEFKYWVRKSDQY